MSAPSEVYPSILRFLQDNGLHKTAKAFCKETSAELSDVAPELFEIFQYFIQQKRNEIAAAPVESEAAVVEEVSKKKKKKSKTEEEPEVVAEATVEEPEVEEVPKKKKKKDKKAVEEVVEEVAEVEEAPKKKKKDKKAKVADVEVVAEAEKENVEVAPVEASAEVSKKRSIDADADNCEEVVEKPYKKPKTVDRFERVNDAEWRAKIAGKQQLIDNSHEAKARFGGSVGDSWGDAAAGDMIKVKGKGFRKEMQKKKRASWKGTGELDQGVNSIPFSDSE